MFKLVISDDEGKTTVVPLVRDEITIGRKEGNTIRLTERNVSRRHARLRKDDGAYLIEDLGSYNGVRINGRRIESEGAAPLQPGDQVVIGDYVIALQSEAADAPSAAAGVADHGPPARLVMLTPPAPGAEFALSRDGMRIGRAEDLDIWVNHRSISREHAVVHVQGETFRVTDSASANGMRLNGREVEEAVLNSGDVIELGQVRFRFVPAGEVYVFDADRTVQMDAIQLPEEQKPSRAPLYAAALIVLVAIGVGALIALGGDSENPTADVVHVEDSPRDPVGVGPSGATPAEAALAAARECEARVAAGEYERAATAAARGLEADPTHAAARACADRARGLASERAIFDRGNAALQRGDGESAYFAFEELPSESELRQQPEVTQARGLYVSQGLEAARAALEGGDPATASRHANAVLTTPDITTEQRREAAAILRSAQRGGVAPVERDPRPGMTSMALAQQRSTTPTVMESTTPVATMTDPAPAAGCDPGNVLRGCNYDQRCVANQLQGCANDARSMGVLVEAYKSIGNNAAAERVMRQIILRFPSSRQAANYRRQLTGE